jgi:hypothetical protein
MFKKVAISAFVVASFSIFFTIGCSPDAQNEHLTRAKAAAIIGASYPKDITGPCPINKQYGLMGDQPMTNISAELAYFDYLKDHNILTYTTIKDKEPEQGTNGQIFKAAISATLTPQGQSLVTGPPSQSGSYYLSNFITVKQGQITLSEITGIVEQGITAEVQYTEKESVTPFGAANCISVKPASKTATFTKYDDGWRLSR